MRRNNFLKALLGIPFIAPLIAKGTKEKHYIDMWGNKIPLSEIQNSAINKAMPELRGEDDLWTYRRVAERDNIRVIKTVDMKQVYCNFIPLDGSGIHREARPRDPFVWREEDIKQNGVWVMCERLGKQNSLAKVTWEINNDKYHKVNGITPIVYNLISTNGWKYINDLRIDVMITILNGWGYRPATKAEVIEMIMNSDKNFI